MIFENLGNYCLKTWDKLNEFQPKEYDTYIYWYVKCCS